VIALILRSVTIRICFCAIIAALLLGCRNRLKPQIVYDQIEISIRRGDLLHARLEVDEALQRFSHASPEWQWRFRILKAAILDSQSDYAGALTCLDGNLPASLVGTDDDVKKSIYQGIALRLARDFGRSKSALMLAETLATTSHQELLPKVLTAEGALEIDQGDYEAANFSYHRGLALARQQHDQIQEAALLLDLARLDTLQQLFDEAIDQNEAALRLSRSLGKQSFVATILGNLGWSYGELGDFEASLDFYKQSAEASAKSGMVGYSAYWFSGVATAYMALHDYSAGEKLALTTLQQAKELKNAATSVACLHALAEIMLRTGRLHEAEQYIDEALALETDGKDLQGAFDDTLTLAGEIATAGARFPDAEKLFQTVLADSSAGPKLRWESEAGLAAVRNGQGKPTEAERHFLAAISIIEKSRRSIDHDELRLSFLSSGIAVYGQYIDFLVRRGRATDALMQAELSRARTLEEVLSTAAPTKKVSLHKFRPEEIAQRLKATLLFYWVGEKQSHLWVIAPASVTCLSLPGADQIDPLVKSYRESLFRSRDPLETGNPDAQKLYDMLIEPAKRLLPKDARVILLPDGGLYGLSFETLIVPEPKPHYWIEDVTLTTASSLTLLASGTARVAPKDKSLFLVGDTVPPNADFPALPQAAAEMQDVEKYFLAPHRAVLSGSQATPTAYLSSQPERFSYLHFVTHGTASRARPLDSAVVLSKEKDADSFKLYARDIVKRPLSAYLVTISACNGAGTRAYSGEGLVGLSWAFLSAGAHNVIGALWEVSDSSTPQLMNSLYDGLSHGQDPAVALRAAKLSLLHSDTVYKKPFYWAPFQLYSGS
jgi:CHAT domain-containing protein